MHAPAFLLLFRNKQQMLVASINQNEAMPAND